MKVVVISDSHGHVANLKHVLGFAKKIKAEAIIHCGDWDNLKAVETVLESKIPLYAVLGNADVDPMIAQNLKLKCQNYNSNLLTFKLGGRKIGVVHSFDHPVSSIQSPSIYFCGHRHFKFDKQVGGVRVVAPGALGGARPSFAVYDTVTDKVEFFKLLP